MRMQAHLMGRRENEVYAISEDAICKDRAREKERTLNDAFARHAAIGRARTQNSSIGRNSK